MADGLFDEILTWVDQHVLLVATLGIAALFVLLGLGLALGDYWV
jgi:hypothetical protein